MKFKSFLLILLSFFLWPGCNEEELDSPKNDSTTSTRVHVDFDSLTATYGPALAKSVQSYPLKIQSSFPQGIIDIIMQPDHPDIPIEGEVRNVIVLGTFDILQFRLMDVSNQVLMDQFAMANLGGYGTTQFGVPEFQATPAGAIRMISFEYFNTDTQQWDCFGVGYQYAKPEEPLQVWTDIAQDIPWQSTQFLIQISGDFPSTDFESVFFRVIDKENTIQSNTVAIVGKSIKSTYQTLFENLSEEPRTLHFQYALSTDLNNWITFETHQQEGYVEPDPGYYFDLFLPDLSPEAIIPYQGGQYEIICVGNVPFDVIEIRVRNNKNDNWEFFHFNSQWSITWDCPLNNDEQFSTEWYFDYSIDGRKTWIFWQGNIQNVNIPIEEGS